MFTPKDSSDTVGPLSGRTIDPPFPLIFPGRRLGTFSTFDACPCRPFWVSYKSQKRSHRPTVSWILPPRNCAYRCLRLSIDPGSAGVFWPAVRFRLLSALTVLNETRVSFSQSTLVLAVPSGTFKVHWRPPGPTFCVNCLLFPPN